MEKLGRNDPCSCGSGQKYKKCCETKKSAPKKIHAQLLQSSDASTGKVQSISRLFQRPAPPAPSPIIPSSPDTPTGKS